ncbi:DUF4426 domain-containing protein [Acidihalobacter aeolianus]|uniref:DUF4426 domain-containing protein n=1 Tax=Acidihalobacter aeolianus TaxID=2792603 RepID=UPI0012EA0208|nr:DUF4426 domain-containing protein [Acidihalobacter aeolianus]
MKTLTPAARAFAALFAIALTGSADADQIVMAGDYLIHLNTINSDFLLAAIAAQVGIQRSPDRGLLELAVQRADAPESAFLPVAATVSAVDGEGRLHRLDVRRSMSSSGTRYLAGFPIVDGELVEFHIHVDLPDGSMQYFRYRQRYHVLCENERALSRGAAVASAAG